MISRIGVMVVVNIRAVEGEYPQPIEKKKYRAFIKIFVRKFVNYFDKTHRIDDSGKDKHMVLLDR